MINLLPPEVKQDIYYARKNTRLLNWCIIIIVSILGAGLITVGGLFYINSSINTYKNQISKSKEQLQTQKIEETQKKVESISSHLRLVVQVLQKEILFSRLIQQIGSAIPAKANLTDLKINKTEGGIDLSAVASDYPTASQVQVNLQDPANKIFDKADIVNITCSSSNTSDPKYPCTVVIRAQFAKNNPFLLINPQSSGNKP